MKLKRQKGVSALIIILIIAVLVVLAVIFYAQRPEEESSDLMDENMEMMTEEMDEEATEEMTEEMAGTDETISADSELDLTGEVIAGSSAKLIDFNQSDFQKAFASDKLVVLYFYANWCPICRVEVQNALYPAFDELTTDEVVGFRVNYNDSQTDDAEEDLAREYGVAYQHTKVFLKNGERILKSPESWQKSRYFEEINKAL